MSAENDAESIHIKTRITKSDKINILLCEKLINVEKIILIMYKRFARYGTVKEVLFFVHKRK